jgi:hypothetical protein
MGVMGVDDGTLLTFLLCLVGVCVLGTACS